jgi:type II secretory pathway component PulK
VASARPRRRGRHFTQRGVALIAVTAALALITTITMEFNYSTNVDYASAANARDSMRAHFLSRSVMSMAELIMKVQKDILDRQRRNLAALGLPDVQIADFMSMLEVPMCGSKDELADMAALANVDVRGMKGLGLDYGMCRVETFTSDDGKINVNCANGSVPTANALAAALTGLVNNAAYDRLFEERDGDGQFTDRQTFIKALLDYVDRDEAAFASSGQPEDYGYESLREPYRAKNNYIDSVDELRLVRGMDDRKWALFGPELTVYGGCKVNVSATNSPIQIMALLFQSAKDPNDPVLLDPMKLYLLAQRVAQARALGMPFEDLNAFVSFVADPDAALGLKSPEGTAMALQSGLAPVDGIQLDTVKLNQVARAGARRTYRVVAAAQVGRVEKRIIGVWDTETHNQNARDPAYARGTWVYWREE